MTVQPPTRPCIAVVLAAYHPDADMLRAQLESLRAQRGVNLALLCVVADLQSGDLIADLCDHIGLRVAVHTPPHTLSSVKAFEAGLSEALERWPEAHAIACCDQDDVWHPDKLVTCWETLRDTGATLAHCDARVVDRAGRVTARSLWRYEWRGRRARVRDLLVRNTVTGMTMMVRPDVVAHALPFPPQEGVHFHHDLWLALVAAATGRIAREPRALVDYRQHGGNAVGAVRRVRLPGWRDLAGRYALARYLAVVLHARYGVERDTVDYRSPPRFGIGLAAQAAGSALRGDLVGAAVAAGLWGSAVARIAYATATTLRSGRAVFAQNLSHLDTRLGRLAPGTTPEAALAHDPHVVPAKAETSTKAQPWWEHFDPRVTPKFTLTPSHARPGYILLVPTLNPTEAFAGIATAIDLGLQLAAGGARLDIVATDLPVAAPAASRAFVAARAPGREVMDHVRLHCGVTGKTVPCHADDRLIATAWWTAHVAHDLITGDGPLRANDFDYLVQDYEPLFYPWGSEHAAAMASYDLPCQPIFNTTILEQHLRREGHLFGGTAPITFRPSINVDQYARLVRPARTGARKLVLYGRPEVARNMFPLAVQALGRFVEETGLTPEDIVCESVGLKHQDVLLPNAVRVQSRGKIAWADYPTYLAGADVGLALMMSPHPSHLPLEMAAAGMRVVTNSYGTKDLSKLTPLIASPPLATPALVDALKSAWTAGEAPDTERNLDLSPLGGPLEAAAKELLRRHPGLAAHPARPIEVDPETRQGRVAA
ncbi:MAG: glycosyltransferase [Pseudomonadota bacterium]